MKMDIEVIKKLPAEMKHELINHIVDLPAELVSAIKISINDPEMDPSLWKNRDRRLSQYATIGKILSDKCNIIPTDNPLSSCYQGEYSLVMKKIDDLPLQMNSKATVLRHIMNMKCYDLESLLCIERAISSMLMDVTDIHQDALHDLVEFVNNEIIPYKLNAIARYQDFLFISSDFYLVGSYPFIDIHHSLTYAIMHMDNSYHVLQNIAILVYVYFKQLNVTDEVVNNCNLFRRFELFINLNNKDADDVHEILVNLFNDNINVESVLSKLTHDKDFDKVLYYDHDNRKDFINDKAENFDTFDGFIFLDGGTGISESINSEMTMEMIKTTKSYIVSCINKLGYVNASENCISFNLSDNDFGHIRNGCSLPIGTATNIFTHESRHITKYEDDWYILFINYMKRNTIFGISISNVGDKKILEIVKDNSVFYKYISII